MKVEMKTSKVILTIIVALVYVAGYVGILEMMHSPAVWYGLLLLWYWGMEKNAGVKPLLYEIVPGSLTGLVIALLLTELPNQFSTFGVISAAIMLISVLFCSFTGRYKNWINGATFLTMTVTTAQALSYGTGFTDYIKIIIVAAVYMGLPGLIKYNRSREAIKEV
ncbi:MAG: hypothetical protein JEZ08_08560 [Clostridiales bacterium]|nr:hypothetical protein [Clostridiales bacterium]